METDYANCLSVGLKSLIRGTQNVYSIREIGRGDLCGGKSNSFFLGSVSFSSGATKAI